MALLLRGALRPGLSRSWSGSSLPGVPEVLSLLVARGQLTAGLLDHRGEVHCTSFDGLQTSFRSSNAASVGAQLLVDAVEPFGVSRGHVHDHFPHFAVVAPFCSATFVLLGQGETTGQVSGVNVTFAHGITEAANEHVTALRVGQLLDLLTQFGIRHKGSV